MLKSNGLKCSAYVEHSGYSGAYRAGATLLFGLAGMAATSGKGTKRIDGRILMKKKGLRFIPEKEKYIEIRILWEDIIHAGVDLKGKAGYVYIYTNAEGRSNYKMANSSAKVVKEVINEHSPLLKKDLEGWE